MGKEKISEITKEYHKTLFDLTVNIKTAKIEDFPDLWSATMVEYFSERKDMKEPYRSFDRLLRITNEEIQEKVTKVIEDIQTIVDYVEQLIKNKENDETDRNHCTKMVDMSVLDFIEYSDRIDEDMELNRVERSRVIPERELKEVLVEEFSYLLELIEGM